MFKIKDILFLQNRVVRHFDAKIRMSVNCGDKS